MVKASAHALLPAAVQHRGFPLARWRLWPWEVVKQRLAFILELWQFSFICDGAKTIKTMRIVLFLTFFLAVLFATTITAILIGAHRLDSSLTQALPFSDCPLPCFAGAVIGQTSVEVAIPQMAKQFEPRGYGLDRRIWGENTTAVSWDKPNVSNINATFTGEVLTAIGMSIDPEDDNMPRLGGLVAALGRPSCVLTAQRLFFNVYYFDKRYVVTIGVKALKLDQRIQWITVETVSKPSYTEMVSNSNCAIVSAQDWRGFAYTKYP